MIVENIIQALKTKALTLSWTPTGNATATTFQAVYTAPVIGQVVGSPWLYIVDEAPSITKIATRGANGDMVYSKNQPITLNICIQYDVDSVKLSESLARMRYATECLETNILRSGVYLSTLNAKGWNYEGWTQTFRSEDNVIIRSLRLILQDTV